MEGISECEIVESSVDGDTLYEFVRLKLQPLLMPFDGKNHQSIVVIDSPSLFQEFAQEGANRAKIQGGAKAPPGPPPPK